MNTFHCVETHYITNSRTIETILLSCEKANSVERVERIFYVYNYEGNSFRFFSTVISLMDFFNGEGEDYIHFETDEELDDFLSEVDLQSELFGFLK